MLEVRSAEKGVAEGCAGLQRMLVAYDGSPASIRALDLAIALGRAPSSELLLCCAIDRTAAMAEPIGSASLERTLRTMDEAAAAALDDALARTKAAGVRASMGVCEGSAAPALIAYAAREHADSIFIGTEGRSGLNRMVFGSTAQAVARASDLPTFIVGAGVVIAESSGHLKRILVALDHSGSSDAAMDFALELAIAHRSRLLCCTVVEAEDLLEKAVTYGFDPAPLLKALHRKAADVAETQAARARERGLSADSIVLEGKPAKAILDVARDHSANLIAIGTHGRRGVGRLFMGSVAETVVRRSSLPVVVVRKAPSAGS